MPDVENEANLGNPNPEMLNLTQTQLEAMAKSMARHDDTANAVGTAVEMAVSKAMSTVGVSPETFLLLQLLPP
jgi:phage-related minor tail protein